MCACVCACVRARARSCARNSYAPGVAQPFDMPPWTKSTRFHWKNGSRLCPREPTQSRARACVRVCAREYLPEEVTVLGTGGKRGDPPIRPVREVEVLHTAARSMCLGALARGLVQDGAGASAAVACVVVYEKTPLRFISSWLPISETTRPPCGACASNVAFASHALERSIYRGDGRGVEVHDQVDHRERVAAAVDEVADDDEESVVLRCNVVHLHHSVLL